MLDARPSAPIRGYPFECFSFGLPALFDQPSTSFTLERDIAVSADDYQYRATVALVLANERRRRSAHPHREAWTAARYRAIPIRRESPPLCPFRPPQQQQGAETGASCAPELASLSP